MHLPNGRLLTVGLLSIVVLEHPDAAPLGSHYDEIAPLKLHHVITSALTNRQFIAQKVQDKQARSYNLRGPDACPRQTSCIKLRVQMNTCVQIVEATDTRRNQKESEYCETCASKKPPRSRLVYAWISSNDLLSACHVTHTCPSVTMTDAT
jgi:hypothetical protein